METIIFIWQAFSDGVFHKGPILFGEKDYVKKLQIRDHPTMLGKFRENFTGENIWAGSWENT